MEQVWTSPYVRAIGTAKYLAWKSGCSLRPDPRLEERRLGRTEGVPETFWLTQLNDPEAKTEGGECAREVRERMEDALFQALEECGEGGRLALVSHAGAITFLLLEWCQLLGAALPEKSRHLTFQGVDVINGPFATPEVFRLEFDGRVLRSICREELAL